MQICFKFLIFMQICLKFSIFYANLIPIFQFVSIFQFLMQIFKKIMQICFKFFYF